MNLKFTTAPLRPIRSVSYCVCLIIACISFCLLNCSKNSQSDSEYRKPYIQLLRDHKYEEAKALAAKALVDARRELGDEHLTTIQIAHDYSFLLSISGPFDEAESLLLNLISLDSAKFGATSLNLGPPCLSLAQVYMKDEKFERSVAYFERSIDVRGGTSPDICAVSYRDIAEIKRQIGRPAEALRLMAKALKADKQLLSKNSFERTVSLLTFARVYTAIGDHTLADSLLTVSNQIACTYLKDTASFFVDWNCAKGDLELDRAHYQSAQYYYSRSSQLLNQRVGSHRPDIAYLGIGFSEFGLGHFEKARAISDSALKSSNPMPISGRIWQGNARLLKGQLLQHNGDFVGADSLFTTALELFSAIGDGKSNYVANVYRMRSNLSKAKGDIRAADSLMSRAKDIAELSLGINAPRMSHLTGTD